MLPGIHIADGGTTSSALKVRVFPVIPCGASNMADPPPQIATITVFFNSPESFSKTFFVNQYFAVTVMDAFRE
jgi:hypothetical protein